MGFLDSLQSSVNRGMAATGRATSTMKLKAQMSEALKRRQALAAQLGASLYDVTKDDANLRAGREALYDGIAACDAERAQCQVEIERLEAESAAATAANSYYVCPFCGSHVVTTDLFCSGCGKPMAEITAALSAQQQAPAAPVAPVSGAAACPPVWCSRQRGGRLLHELRIQPRRSARSRGGCRVRPRACRGSRARACR